VSVPFLGGSCKTVIGLIFLAIVIVTPSGLMGLWDRRWDAAGYREGSGPRAAAAAGTAGPQA